MDQSKSSKSISNSSQSRRTKKTSSTIPAAALSAENRSAGLLESSSCDASRLLRSETLLFFKRWLKNPGRLGTLAPISVRLADVAASCVNNPSTIKMVEIGAGPGRLTRSLLKAGVAHENIKAIELDADLCAFAKKAVPDVDFIHGDAQYLKDLIPEDWIGHVDVVFSTIPFMYLPKDVRYNITEAAFSVLKPSGDFLHLTYNHWSPLEGMAFEQKKVGSLWLNLPPAFIWRYRKQQDPLLKAA